MAKKEKANNEQDLSSFMAILIMTIGALVVLLVSNTLVIISNPENTTVTSVVTSSLVGDGGESGHGSSPFPMGNRHKEPRYIDVHPDRIYLFPGEVVVPSRELERRGSALESFLEEIQENSELEYVVLLVRPHAGEVYRRLSRSVRDRGIDLGTELFEAGRSVNYEARRAASMAAF